MKPFILRRKIARIIAMIAEELHIDEDQALLLFYNSRAGQQLHDPSTGMHLMSDLYVLEEFMMG